jgi:hypothetical protein
MEAINYMAVMVAAFASFIISTVWYTLFSKTMKKLSSAAAATDTMPVWKVLAEFVRSLVLALVLAVLVALTGVTGWTGAVQLAFCLWIGFPVVLLAGSVMWENVPWKLASLHSGDWFFKMHSMLVILGIWR